MKSLKVIKTIIVSLFLIVSIILLFTFLTSKKSDDGSVTIFNHQLRFVQSESMEKSDYTDVSNFEIKDIKMKSVVFLKVKPTNDLELANWYEAIEIGDVLTFKYVYEKQETITHRVIDKIPLSQGYQIILEGDNKTNEVSMRQIINTADQESPNYIIGKVVGQNYLFGQLVSGLQSPLGIIFMIIIPSLLVIIFEVFTIFSRLNELKKERKSNDFDELQKLKNEIAELKKNMEPNQTIKKGGKNENT